MKLRRAWHHEAPYTAEERAAYGARMRAQRAATAVAEAEARAKTEAWYAAHPPAYCTIKRRDEAGVLRYVEYIHGPYAGCSGCDRARAAGVVPADNAVRAEVQA